MKSVEGKKLSLLALAFFLLMLALSIGCSSWAYWPFGRIGMSTDMLLGKDANHMCPMMGRMPVKSISRKNLPEAESRGAELYSKFCSECHGLPDPKNYRVKEWPLIVEKMDDIIKELKQGNPLSDEDKKQIILYLQEYSG